MNTALIEIEPSIAKTRDFASNARSPGRPTRDTCPWRRSVSINSHLEKPLEYLAPVVLPSSEPSIGHSPGPGDRWMVQRKATRTMPLLVKPEGACRKTTRRLAAPIYIFKLSTFRGKVKLTKTSSTPLRRPQMSPHYRRCRSMAPVAQKRGNLQSAFRSVGGIDTCAQAKWRVLSE